MKTATINRISIALLILGLGGGLAIYLTAKPEVLDPLLGDPLTNKKYIHELRLMGGKANVFAAEFTEWFRSLWHGRSLGGTIAVLTVLVTLAFRFVAFRPDIYGAQPNEAGR